MTRRFVYKWGKPDSKKPHRVIFRSPLLELHYYHNKWLQVKESQYLIPTYSWTLIPILNWTCYVVTVPPFDARLPSTWLTNCTDPNTQLQSPIKKVVGCKVLQFIHTMKIKKMLGHKTQWYTYTATSSQEWWTRVRTSSPVTIFLNKVFLMLVQLANLLTALKTIILYV